MAALVDHHSRRSARIAANTMCARANSCAMAAGGIGERFRIDQAGLQRPHNPHHGRHGVGFEQLNADAVVVDLG